MEIRKSTRTRSATTIDWSENAATFHHSKSLALGLITTILLLAFCLPVCGQGTIDADPNDSALSTGRGTASVVNPPAAFSGKERADTASFMMTTPILSLPGRGIGVNLDLSYDSSLYQLIVDNVGVLKVIPTRPNFYRQVYDEAVGGWPGYGFSLGFGAYIDHNAKINCYNSPISCFNGPVGHFPVDTGQTFIDAGGVRHPLEAGISTDSSGIKTVIEGGVPTITYPNGTKIMFGTQPLQSLTTTFQNGQWNENNMVCRQYCDVFDKIYFPTKITDRNGNYILVNYVGGVGPRISSITDTLGRVINFQYLNGRLAAVTAPAQAGAGERVIARFYVGSMTRNHSFFQESYTEPINVLSYVYFPDTKTGFHYSYSSYGMIYRVEKSTGMEADQTGISNPGQVVASTEYNYPLVPSGLNLQVPRYSTRIDRWADVAGVLSTPLTHQFDVQYNYQSHQSITTITGPDLVGSSEVTRKLYSPEERNGPPANTWNDGLVLRERVIKGAVVYAQIDNNWGNGATPGGPLLFDQVTTNDVGQTKKAVFNYFPGPPLVNGRYNGPFDNLRSKTEYTLNAATFESSTEIKRTEYTYETDPAWVDRWLTHLVKSMKVFQGGQTQPIAQIDYIYDHTPLTTYGILPTNYDENIPNQRGNLTFISSLSNTLSPAEGMTVSTLTEFDVLGNPVRTTASDGKVLQLSYADDYSDGQNRNTFALQTQLTSDIPDPSGVHASTEQLTQHSTYDFATGLVISKRDVNGQVVNFEYNDPAYRVTRITLPDGGWSSFEYGDLAGNLYIRTQTPQETQPVQRVLETRQYFDGLGQLARSANSEGNSSWIVTDSVYDTVAHTTSTSNPYRALSLAGISATDWTTTTYDPLGRVSRVTAPDGAESKTDYHGNRALITDIAGKQRITSTNELAQLTTIWEVVPQDSATESASFPNHPEVSAAYRTSYTYDVLGNLRKVEQGGQQARYFSYDSLSRLVRVSVPEQGTNSSLTLSAPDPITNWNQWSTQQSYDNAGKILTTTDARAVRTDYQYDRVGRVTKIRYTYVGCGSEFGCPELPPYYQNTPEVEFFYDGRGMPSENGVPLPTPANAKGSLTAVKSSVSESIFSEFDVMGRVKSYRQITAGAAQPYIMKYEYNQAGALIKEQYPSGRILATEYDDSGRIAGLKNQVSSNYFAGGDPVAANDPNSPMQYTPHGAVSAMKLGNNLWEHHNFDPKRLQVVQIGLGTSRTDSSSLQLDYAYKTPGLNNNHGNVRSQTMTVPGITQPVVQSYTYDQLDRLLSAQETSGGVRQWMQSFTYSRYGNRSIDTSTDQNGQPKTTSALIGPNPLVSDANNRIIRRPNTGEQYDYDPAGNMILDQTGNRTTYDGENHQTTYATASFQTVANYFYDGEGKRVKKVVGDDTTIFVYNLFGQLVAEYGNAPVAGEGGLHYVTSDALGTPRILTRSNGTVDERHDYLPFGENLTGYSGRNALPAYAVDRLRVKFTGYERDSETGTDFAMSRQYTFSAGRFASVDPYLGSASLTGPQTWNRYAYCGNNPLNFVDPTGLDWYRDTQETGNIWHPAWFNDRPEGDRYVPWDLGFAYFNIESNLYWILDPAKPMQYYYFTREAWLADIERIIPASTVPSRESGDWDPTCMNCATFVQELGVKRGPALVQSMEYMWIYMSFFTLPVTSGSQIISLGLNAGTQTAAHAAPALTGTALARQLGAQGEKAVAATADIGTKTAVRTGGRTRIPDGLTVEALSEVKNVKYLGYTRQLRDYAGFAQSTGRRFDLYVRPGAKLSGPLRRARDEGLINILDIKF